MPHKGMLFILALILILAVLGTAQAARLSNAVGQQGQPAAEDRPAGQPAPRPGNPEPSGPKVTIDFRDVDIRVVAKFISEITGRNFIFDKKVRDKVTVYSPTKVSPEEAYRLFEMVLKIHGYTTVPKHDHIKVIKVMASQDARTEDVETRAVPPTDERAKDDRVVTQLIRLQYADANEMRALLQPLVAKTGMIMSYPDGNTLIVTDYASNINRLLKIIESVDTPSEGIQMDIISLKYASARDVAAELQQVLKTTLVPGKKGPAVRGMTYAVVPDDRTNSLIIMARANQIRVIRELVAKLDIPTPRGSDRVHVYFLKNAVAEELAATLNELTGKVAPQAGAKQPSRAPTPLLLQEPVFITADKATNSLIIRAERQDYRVIKDIINKLDIQRAQVLVEGIVMEMTIKKANALGAEWRLLDPSMSNDNLTGFGGTNFGDGLINQLVSNPFAGPDGLILGAARGTLTWGGTTYLNIAALVRALERDADVNILSTPHLLTMDNEEARIVVGEERPFLKSSMTTATGAINPSVTNTYEFKDLGLTLKITPHITQGEFIKLKIFQELKSFLSETETGAITSTKRETETTVQVKDGETVVIGGLISEEMRENRSQVPCLGSIPGLGWAFKVREQDDSKLNLLVLIKPSIIRSSPQLEALTDRKRRESEVVGEREREITSGEEFPQKGFRILED